MVRLIFKYINHFQIKCLHTGIRCAVHTLQLAVNIVFKEHQILKVIEEASGVVNKFKSPTINMLVKKSES